jgi:outer membrane protein OmpA-like peptidoglycan-associated protein
LRLRSLRAKIAQVIKMGRIGRQQGAAARGRGAAFAALSATVSACTPPYSPPALPVAYAPPGQSAPAPPDIAQGAIEQDAPAMTQLVVMPGEAAGIATPTTVTRLVFPEHVFFDFDSDVPRPEAAAALDRLADQIRRTAPGTQLTVLGHTDSVGSAQYNYTLSARRAQGVFEALASRGVDPGELSTVAVGKDQPVAANGTAAGRALNRRVEFLVSPDLGANLAVVRRQPVAARRAGEPIHFAVLRPGPKGEAALQDAGEIEVQTAAPAPRPVRVPIALPPRLAVPAPPPRVELNKPRDVERAPLGPAMSY